MPVVTVNRYVYHRFAKFQELIAVQTGVSAAQQKLMFKYEEFTPEPMAPVSSYPNTSVSKGSRSEHKIFPIYSQQQFQLLFRLHTAELFSANKSFKPQLFSFTFLLFVQVVQVSCEALTRILLRRCPAKFWKVVKFYLCRLRLGKE